LTDWYSILLTLLGLIDVSNSLEHHFRKGRLVLSRVRQSNRRLYWTPFSPRRSINQSVFHCINLGTKSQDTSHTSSCDGFTVDALRRFAPSLLDIIGYPTTLHTMNWSFSGTPMTRDFGLQEDESSAVNEVPVRSCLPTEFPYQFGQVMKSSWYLKFLHPGICYKTRRLSSRNRWSDFRSYFRVTLEKVDELTYLFLDRGWCTPSKRGIDEEVFFVKTQLQILGSLNVLGNHTPFRHLRTNTELSAVDHRLFFHRFVKKLSSIKEDYIKYPNNIDDLKKVMERYATKKLPGCGGSIDVVHLKWSNCPAGEVVTGHN